MNMQEKGDVPYLMNSEDVNLELVFLGPQTTHPLRSITGVIIKFDLILSTYAARLLRSQLEISSQNGWLSRSQSAFVNMQEKGDVYIVKITSHGHSSDDSTLSAVFEKQFGWRSYSI